MDALCRLKPEWNIERPLDSKSVDAVKRQLVDNYNTTYVEAPKNKRTPALVNIERYRETRSDIVALSQSFH
jgi:hypothetical protein